MFGSLRGYDSPTLYHFLYIGARDHGDPVAVLAMKAPVCDQEPDGRTGDAQQRGGIVYSDEFAQFAPPFLIFSDSAKPRMAFASASACSFVVNPWMFSRGSFLCGFIGTSCVATAPVLQSTAV